MNSFNEYFSSIAEIISNDVYNETHKDACHPIDYLSNSFTDPISCINMKFTSYTEIEKIIKSLRYSNAIGYDEIPTKVLKAWLKQ